MNGSRALFRLCGGVSGFDVECLSGFRCFHASSWPLVRCYATKLMTPSKKRQEAHVTADVFSEINSAAVTQWTPVCRFQHIVSLQMLSRFKIYQTLFLVVGSPISLIFSYMDKCSFSVFINVTASAGFALAVLMGISYYSRRIAGLIYYAPMEDYVRISHLTFWGQRREVVVKGVQLLAPNDMESSIPAKRVVPFGVVLRKGIKPFYLVPSQCTIADVKLYEKLFKMSPVASH